MLLIAATGWLSGCASPRATAPAYVVLPPPPSEEVRAQLGTVSVVLGDSPAATEFTQPMGKGRAAGHGGWVGFWTPPAALARGGDGRGVILGLFLSPVVGTAGAIYGAVAGMSKEEYEQVSATLQRSLQQANLPGCLQKTVGDSLRPYTKLSAAGAPTLLEITPTFIRLDGPTEIEPPLRVVCSVQVRLLRAADGAELCTMAFEYSGASRTLREWAAQDGVTLRDALATASACLGEQITERMMLVYPLPDSPAQQRVLPWPPSRSH